MSLRCVVLCLVFFSCSVVMFAQNTGKQPELVMFRLAFFGADSWAPERPDPVSGANPVDDAPKGAPPENTPLRDKPEAIEHQDASSGAGDDSLKGTGDDRMDGLFKQVFAEMDVRLQDSLTEIGRFHVVSAFQRISGKYMSPDVDAREFGSLFVVANRIEVTTTGEVPQIHPSKGHEHHHEHECVWHTEKASCSARAEEAQGWGDAVYSLRVKDA